MSLIVGSVLSNFFPFFPVLFSKHKTKIHDTNFAPSKTPFLLTFIRHDKLYFTLSYFCIFYITVKKFGTLIFFCPQLVTKLLNIRVSYLECRPVCIKPEYECEAVICNNGSLIRLSVFV